MGQAEWDPPATSKGPKSYRRRKAKGKGQSGTRGRGHPRSAVCGCVHGRGCGRQGEGLDWEEDSRRRVRKRVGGRGGGEWGGE